MKDETLISFNKKGLIPGPDETEDDFSERVEYCLDVRKHIQPVLGDEFTEEDAEKNRLILSEVFPASQSIFDIAPDWIPLFFSNYKLAFWQGGCAWIFQIIKESPTSCVLQLRKAFLSSQTYLKFYKREEILIHELAHAGRMAFHEPKFEEVIAYQSSNSAIRRWLGGIIQSQGEARLFMLSLFAAFLGVFLSFWADLPSNDPLLWILPGFPVVLSLLGIIRNFYRQWIYKRCLKKLKVVLNSEEGAYAVIYRLTDKEISDFSSFSISQIIHYAETNKDLSLRWRVISLAYFQ